MKKMFSYGLIAIFVLVNYCFAATLDPAKIVVPADSGRIVEVYKAPDANAPLIVYVQDIHINYEAQKAEVAIMESLVRDYGFDYIMIEAAEYGTTTNAKKYRAKSKQVRETAAESLLKDGTILGVEYLEMVSDYNFTVQGIEDIALYKKETEDHIKIMELGGDISKLIVALQGVASNLKLHVYSKELRDLDEKAAAYNKDEIGLVEYVKFLDGIAKANAIDVKALPNLALFIESAGMEGQIDFAAVETEREAVVAEVEKAKTDTTKVKEELTAKNMQFRTGEISQGAYYIFLKDASETAKIDLTARKNLNMYTKYITTYEKIDTTLLFKEIDQLVDQLKNALIKTPEQKKLSQIDKGLSVLSDMANTKLIPDEYNYYNSNKAGFNLDDWQAFLKNNSAKFGLTGPMPEDLSLLKNNVPLLEKFYASAFERDSAFINNIKTSLAGQKKDKAIIVMGGFHTPNMKRLLKENGFSFVIVAPKVDIVKDYSAIYKENAKKDLEFLNKKAAKQQ